MTTEAAKALLRFVKDMQWRNGKPIGRDWLAAMLESVEEEALDRGYDRGVNAVRRYDPDAVEQVR